MDYYIIVMNIVTCLTKLASPQIVIVRHRDYDPLKYIDAIKNKYTYYDHVFIDTYVPTPR